MKLFEEPRRKRAREWRSSVVQDRRSYWSIITKSTSRDVTDNERGLHLVKIRISRIYYPQVHWTCLKMPSTLHVLEYLWGYSHIRKYNFYKTMSAILFFPAHFCSAQWETSVPSPPSEVIRDKQERKTEVLDSLMR